MNRSLSSKSRSWEGRENVSKFLFRGNNSHNVLIHTPWLREKERESTWVTVSCAGRHTEWTKTKKGVTARSPKVWPPLINSHSFMQTLTNQKSRKGSSWLLIGLNLHKRMCINQKRSHFWVPCCKDTSPITADTCLSQKAAHLTWPDLIPFLLRTQLFEGWLAITQG